jgi:hypothetical protein
MQINAQCKQCKLLLVVLGAAAVLEAVRHHAAVGCKLSLFVCLSAYLWSCYPNEHIL